MKMLVLSWVLLLPFAVFGQTAPDTVRLPASAPGLSMEAYSREINEFQQKLNQEFSDPSRSPLSPAEQAAFKGLPFYPVKLGFRVVAQLVRAAEAPPVAMPTSTDRLPLYRRYGELRFELNGQPQRLTVYQSLDLLRKPEYADYLFVPFTDFTNGHGSYGGGRYLDLRIPPGGATTIVLDFNRAYNPSCAYSHRYSCPVPPPENRLAVAIPAGVQHDH